MKRGRKWEVPSLLESTPVSWVGSCFAKCTEPGINEGKVGSRKELEYKIQTNTDRERYVFPPSPGNNTLQQCVCVSV